MYRSKLPEDFMIGTANSAFQSEGAWDRDGETGERAWKKSRYCFSEVCKTHIAD